LRTHRAAQLRLRLERANVWDHTHDLVFCTDYGTPIDPAQDQREWKALLRSAGVRQVRLHDARHTAATLLLLHGVDIRTVMAIMGWTEVATAQRYVHAVDELRHEAARRIGAALWSTSPDHREPIPGHRAPLGVVDARDPGLGR
jgi:site-specific recombinase XerD